MRLVVAVALLILVATAPARGAGLALVFAIDVSLSVTANSYRLQHDGVARAFESPTLVDSIVAAGGIEALVLEWSDPDKIAVTVDWTHIGDAKDATRFAAAVRATRRSSHGLTAIGSALLAAAASFERLPEPAARQVIDISGDGMTNFGPQPEPIRDALVKRGIVINGLAILSEEPWLAAYYRHYVIGGAGAFVLVVKNDGSFADAMLKKLLIEVARSPLDRPCRSSQRSRRGLRSMEAGHLRTLSLFPTDRMTPKPALRATRPHRCRVY